MSGPFDLQRFVDAQEGVYAAVIAELREGRKRSHWMWFVFPQIRGLGTSEMARRYAISSAAEARAYAAHPVLGARLRECTALVLQVEGRAIGQIFGYPDDLKLRSCMTLFAACAPDPALFQAALAKYFGGAPDPLTLAALGEERPRS
jgi:uncharacterized protein (DUF1810 family)